MVSPGTRLFCRLDQGSGLDRELKRLQVLAELGLLDTDSVPIFEEVTQTAAHFLDSPICMLSVMDRDRQILKSAVGLSRISLMNDLASSRQLPRHESFCTHVVDSQQVLVLPDTVSHPAFANSLLVQQYGICAYVGVPLLTSDGYCIGTLAIMELSPREFSSREIEFLQLTARWSMSEFERNRLLKPQPMLEKQAYSRAMETGSTATLETIDTSAISSVKAELITQMTQELRTPLTSILGMASVLNRQIYGPLTDKQKEYMDIVHNSGQYLLTLVNEILDLGTLDDQSQYLDLSPVDIEMLCQQSLNTLQQLALRREQDLRLTVEPGNRISLLDKDKVRQMLYHLVFGVIQSSNSGTTIRIHVSRKRTQISLTIWTSHPWLGDGLPQPEGYNNDLLNPVVAWLASEVGYSDRLQPEHGALEQPSFSELNGQAGGSPITMEHEKDDKFRKTRHGLGFILSRRLAEAHGGNITLQGSPESGYRYVISLPQFRAIDGSS
jgi:signal transduction histidine kinase